MPLLMSHQLAEGLIAGLLCYLFYRIRGPLRTLPLFPRLASVPIAGGIAFAGVRLLFFSLHADYVSAWSLPFLSLAFFIMQGMWSVGFFGGYHGFVRTFPKK